MFLPLTLFVMVATNTVVVDSAPCSTSLSQCPADDKIVSCVWSSINRCSPMFPKTTCYRRAELIGHVLGRSILLYLLMLWCQFCHSKAKCYNLCKHIMNVCNTNILSNVIKDLKFVFFFPVSSTRWINRWTRFCQHHNRTFVWCMCSSYPWQITKSKNLLLSNPELNFPIDELSCDISGRKLTSSVIAWPAGLSLCWYGQRPCLQALECQIDLCVPQNSYKMPLLQLVSAFDSNFCQI